MARTLGRFRLTQLVGRSRLSMVWRALDPTPAGTAQPKTVFLLLPREQPVDRAAAKRWQEGVRRGARLKHPNLAELLELGETDRWPYALYDAMGWETLAERLKGQAMAAADAAGLFSAALSGLAFAHEGGVLHRDLQPSMLLIGEQGLVRVMGLEVATLAAPATPASASLGSGVRTSIDALALQAQRAAARHDVLCMGLLLHQALSGKPVFDEPDIGALVARLPPLGREIVRLPWDSRCRWPSRCGPSSIAPPTASSASATAAHARCCARWKAGCRPMRRRRRAAAMLLDRLHSAGLPPSPGVPRAARVWR